MKLDSMLTKVQLEHDVYGAMHKALCNIVRANLLTKHQADRMNEIFYADAQRLCAAFEAWLAEVEKSNVETRDGSFDPAKLWRELVCWRERRCAGGKSACAVSGRQ